jgi:hypothetical protein
MEISEQYNKILNHYYLFLTGQIDEVPTHGAPLEEESSIIQRQLIALNECDILTIDSQPGIKEEIYAIKLDSNVILYQREAVSAYMPSVMVNYFKDKLEFTNFLMFWYPLTYKGPMRQFIPISGAKYPNGEKIEMTTRFPVDILEVYRDLQLIMNDFGYTYNDIESDKLVFVEFIDPIWGRQGKLLNALVSIGNGYHKQM